MDDLTKAKDHKIEDIVERLHSFQVVLSDIEGTTTSISFVRSVLKSYCIQKLDNYITEHWDSAQLLDIRREIESTGSAGCKNTNPPGEEKPNSVSKSEKDLVGEYLLNNINSKEASYASKFLLTKIWEEGYECGDLKGHLFPDVIPALRKWRQEGLCIYLYSSGIKFAQKLLFSYSSEGDVHELISDFFDLDVGSKVEAESYKKIMEKLECPAEAAIFLTDNVKEADAARKAGLYAVLVLREGNETIDAEYYNLFPKIHSFEEITSLYNKRKLSSNGESDNVSPMKKKKLTEDMAIGDRK